jgi:hypothetical protein
VQRLAHAIIAAPLPGARAAARPSPPVTGMTGHPHGLCAAWAYAKAHGTRAQQAATFAKLAAASGGAGKVTAYCAATAHPGGSRSHQPHPAAAPHGSGKPSGLLTPHGSGKPSGLPTPHGSGKPSDRPTPRRSGKASGLHRPDGTGSPSTPVHGQARDPRPVAPAEAAR